jgi:hypothetical protein
MTAFFVRLKAWQLIALRVAVFFIPVLIFFAQLSYELPRDPKPAGDVIKLFLRTAGIAAFLQVLLNFTWQRAVISYLYSLLRDKDNEDYTLTNWFLFFSLIAGVGWAGLFFTGYIFYVLNYFQHHNWMFIVFPLLTIATLIFVRKSLLFTYKASDSLLNGIPYKSVKTDWPSAMFFRPYLLQNRVRQVYLKYGDKSLN